MKRRKDFKDIISANAGLSYDHYWRLVALASCDFCFTIPITLRTVILNALFGAYPWISWAETHRGYSRVLHISRVALGKEPLLLYTYEINRWAAASCAYLFFCFFGFASEARRNYRRLASSIAKFLGFTLFAESTPTPGSRVIDHSLRFAHPVSMAQQTGSGSDSDSLADKLSTTAHESDLEAQPHPPVERPTCVGSTSLSIDEVPRVPELVFDPASAGRPCLLVVPKCTEAGNALDRE